MVAVILCFGGVLPPVKGGASLFLLQAIHHRPKPTGMQVQPDAYISPPCLIDIFRIKQTAAVYAAISLFNNVFWFLPEDFHSNASEREKTTEKESLYTCSRNTVSL